MFQVNEKLQYSLFPPFSVRGNIFKCWCRVIGLVETQCRPGLNTSIIYFLSFSVAVVPEFVSSGCDLRRVSHALDGPYICFFSLPFPFIFFHCLHFSFHFLSVPCISGFPFLQFPFLSFHFLSVPSISFPLLPFPFLSFLSISIPSFSFPPISFLSYFFPSLQLCFDYIIN